MAKRVKEAPIHNLRGKPFKVVERDEVGDVVWEDEDASKPARVSATASLLLVDLILGFPVRIRPLTRQDTIHGNRLYDQLMASAHAWEKDGLESEERFLDIEDAEWEWVTKMLEDDKVGATLYGMNLPSVEKQLRGLEEVGEEDRKAEKAHRKLPGASVDGASEEAPVKAKAKRS